MVWPAAFITPQVGRSRRDALCPDPDQLPYPPGSGQAATTIPIMAPLSDILGIPRQIAVLAYQYGDGFSNILWPTTLLPVMCGIAKVPIERWWKYFVPFFFLLFSVQMVFIFVAVLINYS